MATQKVWRSMGTTKKNSKKNTDSSHANRFFQHYTSWAIKKAWMWIKWASSNDVTLELLRVASKVPKAKKKRKKVKG